jgi:hypothetical protein
MPVVDQIAAERIARQVETIICACGHPALDHHGLDPRDGCLGIASHRLPQCPCERTCADVMTSSSTSVQEGTDG